MTDVVDIDNTLLRSDGPPAYENAVPLAQEIEAVNAAFAAGNTIVIHTGRGADKELLTRRQLERFGVRFHKLVMGKPDGVCVDADALTTLRGKW
jgi:hydroxymethylpyrimidine pyrophosphatase-like HAD family hydrolase